MAVEVVIPEVGESGMAVTFVRWLKAEGDQVRPGDPLFELDTDKSVMEVEAFAEGHLVDLRVSGGETVEPRQVVALLAGDPKESPEPDSQQPDPVAGTRGDSGVTEESPPARTGVGEKSGQATPKVRRLARERGVDLAEVTGTGPGGTVTEHDVLSAETVVQRTHRGRKAVAEMTTASWRTTPHFHLRLEADITDGLERSKPMALLCAAVARCLARHPEYNLAWKDGKVIRQGEVNLGILVDTPSGLLLPAIRGADRLDLRQMAQGVADAAARAREGRLTSEDSVARSVTVSNLGMFSVDQFLGVIPAHDVLLLGIGRTRTAPRWDGQSWVPRRVVDLTLSADHRALDGADAGRLLGTLEAVLAELGA